MLYLTWFLRIVHILSGVVWVGGALVMYFFIAPTSQATADAGQKFMGHLMGVTRLRTTFTVAAFLTVLAGLALFWIDSNGFTSDWMRSSAAQGFSIGAFFAIVGLVAGLMGGSNIAALGKLGAQAQGKPTPEQLQQMQAIQKRLAVLGPINVYSLILAVLFMSIARYLRF